MHMADALLSPEVGASCWLASGALLAWCARSVKQDHREDLVTVGMLSWFASSQPDGLEWSVARITGQAELAAPESAFHAKLSGWQAASAILRDYSLDSGSKRAEALVLSAPVAPKSVVNPDFGSKQAVAGVLPAPDATKPVAYPAWLAVQAPRWRAFWVV